MDAATGSALQSPNMTTQYEQNGTGINPLTGLPYGGSQSSMPVQGIQAGIQLPQIGMSGMANPQFGAQPTNQPQPMYQNPFNMQFGSGAVPPIAGQATDPSQCINQITRYGMGGY
jgi:hypothetical protein